MVSSRRSSDGVLGFSGSVAWFSVLLLVLIFIARAGYFFRVYLQELPLYYGEVMHQVFILLYLLIGLFYLVAAGGLFLKRVFGRYIAYFLVFLDVALSGVFLYNVYYMLLSLVVIVLILVLLNGSKPYFREFDKTDKRVLQAVVVVVVLYVLVLAWGFSQPKPEEYQAMVTKEAIEKNDVKICDKLKNGKERKCFEEFAVYYKNVSTCNLIANGNARDSCFFRLAMNMKNFTLCDNIGNNYERSACHSFEN